MEQTSSKKQNKWPTLGFVVAFVGIVGTFCHVKFWVGQTDPAVLQTSARSEVPVEIYNRDLPIVKATIGNIGNVNVILDTGTNMSVIGRKIANRLKLVGTSETLQTLAGSIHADSAILSGIEFRVLHADSIRVIVRDLSRIERNLGFSLGESVGLDVVSARKLTIDHQMKKIVFGSMPANENAVTFAAATPLLTVDAIIDGRQDRLLLDSGSCGLVVFRNRLRVRMGKIITDRAASISGIGGSARVSWFRLFVSIRNVMAFGADIAIADMDFNAAYGFDALIGFDKMAIRQGFIWFPERAVWLGLTGRP